MDTYLHPTPRMKLPRLYPILDTAALAERTLSPDAVAEVWLASGAEILQFRHKGNWTREIYQIAQRVADVCREHKALCIVNDRADYALLLKAGLHVGQHDLEPADARRVIGQKAVLGFSSHHAGQIKEAAAEPVDYVALGPVFPTLSKANPDPVVGMAALRICRTLVDKPLVAIGGITRENALEALEAGADSLAVIGDLLPEPCTMESLQERMEEWQQLVKT
jgi:thiamine-phosphate pyrophosphorylase